MTFKYLMTLSIGLLTLTSCEKTAPQPIQVNTVEQDFELSTSQVINDSGNVFLITIKSQEVSDCENTVLDATYSIQNQKITITINGNTLDGDCIEGEIITEKSFELPKEKGTYDIEIIKGELLSTSGTLSISDTDFDLEVESLGGIFVEGQNLKIIPEFLVWGYYADNMPDATTQTFLEEMVTEIGFRQIPFENLEEGDYSLFKVDSDGNIILEDVKLDHIAVAYNMEDETFWGKLLLRLPEFSTNFPRLKYRFDRWDGEFVEN